MVEKMMVRTITFCGSNAKHVLHAQFDNRQKACPYRATTDAANGTSDI